MARTEIPPDTLLGGKIRLIKRIGRGGMGEVWVARNEATQAELAVKTLHRSERSPLHDERFRREARLSATISHRNVVRVFDLVDEADGTLGLVMELLRGGTLEECMRERGTQPSAQVIAAALPVLSAMHHVHQKGIVHRDVKPANVFFAVEPDGHVIPKVLDFGIAKLPAAGSALTIDGSVLGTPHYMSPEQIRGREDIDGRSDMFSFAVVLYEMLTGVRVFQRETASASLAAVLEHEVDPDPRIEPRLWIAISRALAKRPYERFATCAEFADALRAATDATDDELAQLLQELRPCGDAASGGSTSPSSLVVSAEHPPASRRLRVATALSIAAGSAVLAALLTLALRPGPSDASAASAAPSEDPVLPAAQPAPTTEAPTREPTPAPAPSDVPAAPAAETSGAADPPRAPANEAAPAQASAPAKARPTPAARTPRTKRPDKGTTKPRASSGSVATTPGF